MGEKSKLARVTQISIFHQLAIIWKSYFFEIMK